MLKMAVQIRGGGRQTPLPACLWLKNFVFIFHFNMIFNWFCTLSKKSIIIFFLNFNWYSLIQIYPVFRTIANNPTCFNSFSSSGTGKFFLKIILKSYYSTIHLWTIKLKYLISWWTLVLSCFIFWNFRHLWLNWWLKIKIIFKSTILTFSFLISYKIS